MASGSRTPLWDPIAQVWSDGVVPETDSSALQAMIKANNGALRLFGYGSLCWKPGDGPLADSTTTRTLGRALHYHRCWAQKSTDHRGVPQFPGLVCTLLKQEEVHELKRVQHSSPASAPLACSTRGVLYTVAPPLVDKCLAELDFREKGGYAREVIDVVEDESGATVQALLYRGTPDNPSFFSRALRDLRAAAALVSVSEGPSGANVEYLYELNQFLETPSVSLVKKTDGELEDDTLALTALTRYFETKKIFFVRGIGSNQHNQLRLSSYASYLHSGDESHELEEAFICTEKKDIGYIQHLYAGGGHSGLLTTTGDLILWGWNENGQLGACASTSSKEVAGLPVETLSSMPNISKAALGFAHTIIVEIETGIVSAFGDNSKGQVDGSSTTGNSSAPATTPDFLRGKRVLQVAAGVFHSAVITSENELVTFGSGGALGEFSNGSQLHWVWAPPDGVKLLHVACGRKYTMVVDELGRLWSFGDNKFGQLGRDGDSLKPNLVWLPKGWLVTNVSCGWSHTVVVAHHRENPDTTSCFGWGRNDKGQLGLSTVESKVCSPVAIATQIGTKPIRSIHCGSESTVFVDENNNLWSCGWNEHGNVGASIDDDNEIVTTPRQLTGSGFRCSSGPPLPGQEHNLMVACGGSHVLVANVVSTPFIADKTSVEEHIS